MCKMCRKDTVVKWCERVLVRTEERGGDEVDGYC